MGIAPLIFDRLSKQLQRNRILSRTTDLSKAFFLKEESAKRLADRVLDLKREHHGQVLNLSSDGGSMVRHLPDDLFTHITTCDTSKLLLDASVPISDKVSSCVYESEEELPFKPESFELILSNLTLHWSNDLSAVFAHLASLLREDCPLIGCMLGGDTLFELRCSLQQAEQEICGGMAMRTSPMTDAPSVASALSTAFRLVTVDTEDVMVGYPSLMDLMKSLQCMGESNAAYSRHSYLRKSVIRRAEEIYRQEYSCPERPDHLQATFHLIWFIGWKEAVGQPTPLTRGSATQSLKNV